MPRTPPDLASAHCRSVDVSAPLRTPAVLCISQALPRLLVLPALTPGVTTRCNMVDPAQLAHPPWEAGAEKRDSSGAPAAPSADVLAINVA